MSTQLLQDNRLVIGAGLAILVSAVAIAPMIQLGRSLAKGSMPVISEWRSAPVVHVRKLAMAPAKKKAAVIVRNENVLALQSLLKDYTFTFTGTTLCHGQPCSAEMEISIMPDKGEPVLVTMKSEPNGRYWFEVPFMARPRQQLDWTLTMHGDEKTLQTGGRQILMDDHNQTFAKDFNLR